MVRTRIARARIVRTPSRFRAGLASVGNTAHHDRRRGGRPGGAPPFSLPGGAGPTPCWKEEPCHVICEYRCLECGRRFSHLRRGGGCPALECPRCKSVKLKRLISRFAQVRSEEEMLDSLDPSRFGDIEDPANMRRWARSLGQEMGEELGDDFEESLDEMIAAEEKGEPLGDDGSAGEESLPAAAPAGADVL